jgi:hypothetical protein
MVLLLRAKISFVFFDTGIQMGFIDPLLQLFGNGIPVIAGGTGIFLYADLWAPVINANELGEIQLVFDICVSA